MGIQERKEREREARREEIVNAAQKVFFEKGIAGTTVDEIAQVAELSKGTLYLYYHSKEDLYLAVVCRGLEIMYQMFERAVATGEDPVKLIVNLRDAYQAFFRDHRDFFRTFIFFENAQMHSQASDQMKLQCMESDRKVWELVTSVVKRAIDEGLFRPDLDPLEAGIILWSNANGFLRLMDRMQEGWKQGFGIDFERTLVKSNALLLEAMLTEKGRQRSSGVVDDPGNAGT